NQRRRKCEGRFLCDYRDSVRQEHIVGALGLSGFAYSAQTCEYRRVFRTCRGEPMNLPRQSTGSDSNPLTEGSLGEVQGIEGSPNFVLSLARGLKVIETFEGHTGGQSVAAA